MFEYGAVCDWKVERQYRIEYSAFNENTFLIVVRYSPVDNNGWNYRYADNLNNADFVLPSALRSIE